jgi:hypothetical protein
MIKISIKVKNDKYLGIEGVVFLYYVLSFCQAVKMQYFTIFFITLKNIFLVKDCIQKTLL